MNGMTIIGDGTPVSAAVSGGTIRFHDPSDGVPKTTVELLPPNFRRVSAAGGDFVYACAFRSMFGVHADGTVTFNTTFSFSTGICGVEPIVTDDLVIGQVDSAGMQAFFRVNGSVAWTITSDLFRSTPTLASTGLLYTVINNPTDLVEIDAATGQIARGPLAVACGSLLGSPVLSHTGDKLYIGCLGKLVQVDLATFAVNWTHAVPLYVSTPVLSHDGALVISSTTGTAGRTFAVDTATGTGVWTLLLNSETTAPTLSFDGSVVYIGSFDGLVRAVRVADGVELWAYDCGDKVYTSPAIGPDGAVYAAGEYTAWHRIVVHPVVYIAEGPAVTVHEHERRVNLTVRNGDTSRAPVAFTVDVVATDLTATGGGVDHSAVPVTTLTFAAGEFERALLVPITMDALSGEANETFVLRLRNLVPLDAGGVTSLEAHAPRIAASSNTTTVTIIDSPYPYLNSSWPRRGLDNRGSSSRVASVTDAGAVFGAAQRFQRAAPGKVRAPKTTIITAGVAISADGTVITAANPGCEAFVNMESIWFHDGKLIPGLGMLTTPALVDRVDGFVVICLFLFCVCFVFCFLFLFFLTYSIPNTLLIGFFSAPEKMYFSCVPGRPFLACVLTMDSSSFGRLFCQHRLERSQRLVTNWDLPWIRQLRCTPSI
jgi:hypothetical protein